MSLRIDGGLNNFTTIKLGKSRYRLYWIVTSPINQQFKNKLWYKILSNIARCSLQFLIKVMFVQDNLLKIFYITHTVLRLCYYFRFTLPLIMIASYMIHIKLKWSIFLHTFVDPLICTCLLRVSLVVAKSDTRSTKFY